MLCGINQYKNVKVRNKIKIIEKELFELEDIIRTETLITKYLNQKYRIVHCQSFKLINGNTRILVMFHKEKIVGNIVKPISREPNYRN